MCFHTVKFLNSTHPRVSQIFHDCPQSPHLPSSACSVAVLIVNANVVKVTILRVLVRLDAHAVTNITQCSLQQNSCYRTLGQNCPAALPGIKSMDFTAKQVFYSFLKAKVMTNPIQQGKSLAADLYLSSDFYSISYSQLLIFQL